MIFRVGQRVRLLHESGEGVITDLIDAKHIEVDLGGDFPIEAHISEVVPIDDQSTSFYTLKDPAKEMSVHSFGNVLELSMAATRPQEGTIQLHIINPEPIEILYTCYTKQKHKYQGMTAGLVGHKETRPLFSLPEEELKQVKSFYFQLLSFKAGKGHPHVPEVQEFPWHKNQLNSPTSRIESLKDSGWLFSLRKTVSKLEEAVQQELIEPKIQVQAPAREKIVDLHIEKLVDKPHLLAPSDILKIQLRNAEEQLSKALEENCSAIVFIHGVGIGTLKKEIKSLLMTFSEVLEIHPGDPAKYGNGATKAILE